MGWIVFEPLFLLLALATAITVLTVLVLALVGRFARAGRILRRLAICAAIYMTTVLGVSAFTPRRVRPIGEMRCKDDWCITVEKAVRDTPATYDVSLRLSSRARRVPQGEDGTVIYITDDRGRRFDPIEARVPFSYRLQPGESIQASRRFAVPADARGLNIVYVGEGGFPIGFFIIGENHLFQGPDVVPIDDSAAASGRR